MAKVEVITRSERRRRWSDQEKMEILREVEASGGRVGEVARRRGMSEGLLYEWRAKWRKASQAVTGVPSFVPIGMFTAAADESPAVAVPTASGAVSSCRPGEQRPMTIPPLPLGDRPGVMEVELPGGARLRVDAFVNERALVRVLKALRDVP